MTGEDTLPRHDGWGMTDEQLDGLHCTYCDQGDGAMEPVYIGPRGQMFRHPACTAQLEAIDGDNRG